MLQGLLKKINAIRTIQDLPSKKAAYSFLLDTTNGCNLRCSFCTRSSNRVLRMTTEKFETIISKICRHAVSLQLSCAWEYSIANNAGEIIRALGTYKIPATTIYTNGNIVTEDIAEAVIDARLNDFVVSIGEAKKDTYERLRRGGNFDKVISNIRELTRLKKKLNSRLPHICTNLTVVNSNIGELLEFVDLARSIGVERIIGRHLILNEGLDMENEIIKDQSRANEILDAAEKKAVHYGMTFSIPRYGVLTPKQCRAPWQQLYISSSGDVSVCPRIHMYEKIGNLLTDSFDSIVKSDEMNTLKNQFNNLGFRNPVCGICMENRETEHPINQGF